jgi:hypothetical protein
MLIASMLLFLIVLVGLGVGYATGVIRFGADATVVKSDVEPSSTVTKPAEQFDRPQPVRDRSEQPRARPDRSPGTASDVNDNPSEQPPDPEQMDRFHTELQSARKALGKREYQQAKERIAAARQLAVTEEQNQTVTAHQALTTYTEGFWDAVREGIKKLETTGELKIGDTIVSVVEVGPGHILLREAGENRRYSVDQLPPRLALAIAEHWFDDRAVNKLSLGAYYFVTPPIDAAQARRLWEEAATQGVDVKGLLRLLQIDD